MCEVSVSTSTRELGEIKKKTSAWAFWAGVRAQNAHLAVALDERTDNVHLDATIEREHLVFVTLAVNLWLGDRDLRNKVTLVHVDK